jgi:hypothetical protein
VTSVSIKQFRQIAFAITFALSSASSASSEQIAKTALTSIGAVSSLDVGHDSEDPGIGGGFDQEAYFQNRYIPDLASCTEQIERIFVSWTSANELVLPRREAGADRLFIHATSDTLDGIFELTYQIDAQRERARVSVFFILKDGTALDPVLINPILENWSIAGLQDDLNVALKCDQA